MRRELELERWKLDSCNVRTHYENWICSINKNECTISSFAQLFVNLSRIIIVVDNVKQCCKSKIEECMSITLLHIKRCKYLNEIEQISKNESNINDNSSQILSNSIKCFEYTSLKIDFSRKILESTSKIWYSKRSNCNNNSIIFKAFSWRTLSD